MKIGIILETKEPEKAWNAFRFATTARKVGHDVKLFLLGEAVECEGLKHERYDVPAQMKGFLEAGGELLACGTCLKSRKLEDSTECPISTMLDCVNLVTWAERVVTF
jgi:sulfur relay (sulfurtransferase) complex TusBCD TusD component (DsrE family)